MSKISPRQLYFFLACVAPVGKLVLLPTHLANIAGNDFLYPLLVQYVIGAAAVFCTLLLVRRGKTLPVLLEEVCGKAVSRILCTLLSLFLFYATLVPLLEQKTFVQSVFYDTLPSLAAFAPFFLFAAYLMAAPLERQGRMWDLLAPVAAVGLAGILVLSFGSADYGALLPAVSMGFKSFSEGTMSATSWFYDSAILLTMLGKVEEEKGIAVKGMLFYLLGGAAVGLFFATFCAVFADTAVNQLFAFSKTSKYFAGITVLGRIDYFFIFLLAMVMAFYCVLPAQAGVDLLVGAFHKPRFLGPAVAVLLAAAYFTVSVSLDYRFGELVKAVTSTSFWVFPVFTVLAPVLLLALRGGRRES